VPRQKSVTSEREQAVPDVITHIAMATAISRHKQHGRWKSSHMSYISYFSYHRPLLNRLSVKL
jgi:hypothetical protein